MNPLLESFGINSSCIVDSHLILIMNDLLYIYILISQYSVQCWQNGMSGGNGPDVLCRVVMELEEGLESVMETTVWEMMYKMNRASKQNAVDQVSQITDIGKWKLVSQITDSRNSNHWSVKIQILQSGYWLVK